MIRISHENEFLMGIYHISLERLWICALSDSSGSSTVSVVISQAHLGVAVSSHWAHLYPEAGLSPWHENE